MCRVGTIFRKIKTEKLYTFVLVPLFALDSKRKHKMCTVVYFDIETTGLSLKDDKITVACFIIQERPPNSANTKHVTYNMCVDTSCTTLANFCQGIVGVLENCDIIVAYNGIRFDIPFVAKWVHDTTGIDYTFAWLAKTLDYCDIIFCKTGAFQSMQDMCKKNNINVEKSASGKQAVLWAKAGKWQELEAYCMQDVVVLVSLTDCAVQNGLHIARWQPRNVLHKWPSFTLCLTDKLAVTCIHTDSKQTRNTMSLESYMVVCKA